MLTPAYAAAWSPAGPDRSRAAPVFLVGFPHSGTTLLDTLLMGHREVHVLEEEPLLQRVGEALAERAKAAGVEAIVFDRNGFRYHGRIKALADAARKAGLKF